VWYGNAVPQAGGTEFFAGKQAVEDFGTGNTRFVFQQQSGLLKQAFFTADFQIQQDV
jgi:hypothetical protein